MGDIFTQAFVFLVVMLIVACVVGKIWEERWR
jgi:hypothetical protein